MSRFRSFVAPFVQRCHVCGEYKLWGCECGWIIAAAIAGVVIAAAAAGYSAYSASEAQAQQARTAKKMAKRQSEADAAAGEARRKQVEYDAKRKAQGIRTRQAAAGVQIGEGSLLESEMQYHADAEYAAQIAQLPFQFQSDAADYESRIFGSTARRIKSSQGATTGVAAGSTLATGAGSVASAYSRSSTDPAATESY